MKVITITIFSLFSFSLFAINPDSTGIKKDQKDSNLVLKDIRFAAQIDSSITCHYEEMMPAFSSFEINEEIAIDSVPQFESEIYQARLAELNKRTPFDLSHNQIVEAFIKLYMVKKRPLSEKCLGRSEQYFPMIEEVLDRYQLPYELKYLAVVESALDPRARSRAGATGLWQFMYGTGRIFGLSTNSYADQRLDPVASTEAACKYLTYLYNMFGDWNLALAAYNCGEGRVARAIRRSGGKKDYWEVYNYLPRETRGYVPAFIAVNYMFEHHADHGLRPVPVLYNEFETDTVHVRKPITFQTVSEIVDLHHEIIADLNPVYRSNYIPAFDEFNVLRLPKDRIGLWVSNEDTIYALIEEKTKSEPEEEKVSGNVFYYTVQYGDYLGRIASRHGCSVRQIQEWNNIYGTNIRPGQRLTLYTSHAQAPTAVKKNYEVIEDGDAVYYQIRTGDTLWDIAKARGVSVDALKQWNSSLDFNRLKPGMKIIVGKRS